MTYKELLLDWRWGKRISEIKERDAWDCVFCNKEFLLQKDLFPNNNNLQVHHLRYFKDRMPWDYEDCYLVTLCEVCHSMCYKNNVINKLIEEYFQTPEMSFVFKGESIQEIQRRNSEEEIDLCTLTTEMHLNNYEIDLIRKSSKELPYEIESVVYQIEKFERKITESTTFIIGSERYNLLSLLEHLGYDYYIDRMATNIAQLKHKEKIRKDAATMLNSWNILQKKKYESN